MDLYSSDVGAIQEGNMRTKAVTDANKAVKAHNDDVAVQIKGLKAQAQSSESSTLMGEATQQFWASGKIPGAAKAFSDWQTGATDFRGNPIGALKDTAGKLAGTNPTTSTVGEATPEAPEAPPEGAPPEGGAEGAEGAGEGVGEEALEGGGEALGEETAETGLSTLGKGLSGVTALATGGFDIYQDVKAGGIAGDNWASKTSNILQIGGAIADLGGTVFPPLAIVGGVADIAAGVFGEVGAVKDEGKKESDLDTTQQQDTETTQTVSEQQQATTGRVQG